MYMQGRDVCTCRVVMYVPVHWQQQSEQELLHRWPCVSQGQRPSPRGTLGTLYDQLEQLHVLDTSHQKL